LDLQLHNGFAFFIYFGLEIKLALLSQIFYLFCLRLFVLEVLPKLDQTVLWMGTIAHVYGRYWNRTTVCRIGLAQCPPLGRGPMHFTWFPILNDVFALIHFHNFRRESGLFHLIFSFDLSHFFNEQIFEMIFLNSSLIESMASILRTSCGGSLGGGQLY
jgi:hypothetical protein